MGQDMGLDMDTKDKVSFIVTILAIRIIITSLGFPDKEVLFISKGTMMSSKVSRSMFLKQASMSFPSWFFRAYTMNLI
jgi:hypothetical protein